MAETKNEVAEQPKQSFSMALTESLNEVSGALPQGFNTTRFVQNAVALLNENTQLADFARKNGTGQIKQGMMKAAYLGLDFMNKEAYLIPFGNTLNFMIDYKGNTKLAKEHSIRPIKDIYAKLVRKGDEFQENIVNGEPSIDFKPLPFNNDEIIGAFAVCLFADGGMIYDSMSKEDMENTRKSSKQANGVTWKNFTGEMYKKTVLHRLCKTIEISFSNPEQTKYFNEDMEIETDQQKIVENEVAENQCSEEFIIDEVPSENADPEFME